MTNLYAPVATQVASQVAVAPISQMVATRTTPIAAAVEPLVQENAVEEYAAQSTQSATNPAVFGLLAIPVGILALMMRRSPAPTFDEDVEGGLNPVHAAAAAGAFGVAAAQPAMAAQQVAEVADGRLGFLLALLVPALGWVGFNILQPALRQLDNMSAKNDGRPASSAPKKGRR